MPHIHTKPGEHDHCASAFIVRTDGPESRLMLHMHRKLGVLMQFGGHTELRQTPWQAVRDELRQESGYDLSQLHILQPRGWLRNLSGAAFHPIPISHMTHKFPGMDHYHTDLEYGFVTSEAPAHEIETGESSDIHLLTLDQLNQLPSTEIPESVREVGAFLLEFVLKEWEPLSTEEFQL